MRNTFARRAAVILLAVLFALCGLSAGVAERTEKKATVMVYLCGSSLEVKNGLKIGQATQTISDILASRFNTEDVNVVVLLGGATAWASGYDPNVLTMIYFGGRRPQIIETLPLASMGAPDTLRDFLSYCGENYPAERYFLVLWDHGGGPLFGVCQDMLFPDDSRGYGNDMLNMFELKQALEESPFADKGLDMIVFHACLMGSAEVASMIAPYAKYMVGSEDSMYGLTYDWLAGLENDAAPLDTAIRLVDSSFAYNGAVIENQQAREINAMSVVDLSAIDGLVEAMDVFFTGINGTLNDATFTAMSNQRRDTTAFGLGDSGNDSDFDLIDLGDMTDRYREMNPAGAEAVEEALEQAVVYKRVSLDTCSGLTVYHPYRNTSAMPERIGIYNGLGFSESYTSYLQSFAAIMTGTPLADWTELITANGVSKDLHTFFELPLNEEQAAHYGSSVLYVLLKNEDGSFSFTFANAETELNAQDQLTADFNGTALYAVNADSERLSSELEYRVSNAGRYLIPATLIKHGKEDGSEIAQTALIVCAPDEVTGRLIPGAVEIWEESLGGYTNAYCLSFSDFDEVVLTGTSRLQPDVINGAVPPFEQWEIAGTTEYRTAIDDSWSFAFVNDTLDRTLLYATFQVNDSQNNTYGSVPLVVKEQGPASDALRLEYEDYDLVLIQKLNIIPTAGDLAISASLTNLTDGEVIIRLENLKLNGQENDASTEVIGSGENWGLMPGEDQILYLAVSGIEDMDTVTSIQFDLVVLDAASEEVVGTVPADISLSLELSAE